MKMVTITLEYADNLDQSSAIGHLITELLNTSKDDLNKDEHRIATGKILAVISNWEGWR